jgi:hypothetical protein
MMPRFLNRYVQDDLGTFEPRDADGPEDEVRGLRPLRGRRSAAPPFTA